MDARTGWCEGCYRSLDEISQWSQLDDAGKRALWLQIEQRLTLKTA